MENAQQVSVEENKTLKEELRQLQRQLNACKKEMKESIGAKQAVNDDLQDTLKTVKCV